MLKKFASVDRVALSKSLLSDVDLPAFVSNGYVYIQAPLPLVFQAFGEDLPTSCAIWKLEYQQRAPTLSLGSDGVPFLARQWLSRRGTRS